MTKKKHKIKIAENVHKTLWSPYKIMSMGEIDEKLYFKIKEYLDKFDVIIDTTCIGCYGDILNQYCEYY